MDEDKQGDRTSDDQVDGLGDTETTSDEQVDPDTLKAELEKERKARRDQENRARLLEEENKKLKKAPKGDVQQNLGDLSQKDVIALARANVHDNDLDEVISYAKFKGVTVAEALQTDYIKTTLTTNAEKRKSAETASAGNVKRGSGGKTDEAVLANLAKGNVPVPGSSEAEQLFWARRGGKR